MERRKTIGGFLSLELPKRTEYHSRALRLNSARYCLEYILRVRNYKKIYLPAYICDSVLQPVKRLNVPFNFYRIGEDFAPVLDREPEEDACFLYVNYFGLHRENVRKICCTRKHVVIDNTQAFFERPLPHADTLYSPRKFFGVPDGGYLYTDAESRPDLKRNASYYRFDALLKQIDLGSTAAAPLFEENEAYLDRCGMQAMARLTQRLLMSIDYRQAITKRNENFHFLNERLRPYNRLKTVFGNLNGPMCYPLLTEYGEQLKEFLIERNIYVNDYWQEVIARVPSGSFECRLARDLVLLPVDQHCGTADMQAVMQAVLDFFTIYVQ
ncbi:hypothetical protein [Sporolactobacillus sp. KGMB 08714]|uniref:hypothetical protein n=1 Tax=Sporolactobacillus sp. KGMB 08714 TaxID=3064704 RepID=UPI002FBD97D6